MEFKQLKLGLNGVIIGAIALLIAVVISNFDIGIG